MSDYTLLELAEKPMKRCDTCKVVERILQKIFTDDDSHVISLIVELIRIETNIKDFAKGASLEDHKIKVSCPHCHNTDTQEVIFGYSEDNPELLQKEKLGLVYLTGCVPDSYGVDIGGKWFYPKNRCDQCKKFFNFSEDWL